MFRVFHYNYLMVCSTIYGLCDSVSPIFSADYDSIGFDWKGYDTPPGTPVTPVTSTTPLKTKDLLCYRRDGRFVCPDCAQKFKSISGLKYHLEKSVCRGEEADARRLPGAQLDYNEKKPISNPLEAKGIAEDTDNDKQWNKQFRALCKYKYKHGNCDGGHGEDPLCRWVKRQRYGLRSWLAGEKTMFTAQRKESLDMIGFEWKDYDALPVSKTGNGEALAESTPVRGTRTRHITSTPLAGIKEENSADKQWNTMFDQLVKYKTQRGHFDGIYTVDESLGRFAVLQRHELRAMLAEERSDFTYEKKALLDKIGFDWKGYDIPPESSDEESGEDSENEDQGDEEDETSEDESSTSASNSEDYCCPNCDQEFSSKSGLNYHIDNSVCGVIACRRCNKMFKSENGLKYHLVHAICQRSSNAGTGIVKAGEGDEEDETSEDESSTSASNGEDYCCPNCDQEFSSKSGLNYHIDNSVCGVIACRRCNKMFKSENGLKYHLVHAICQRSSNASTGIVKATKKPTITTVQAKATKKPME